MFTVKLTARLQFKTLAEFQMWEDTFVEAPNVVDHDTTLEDDPESNGDGLVDPADYASMLVSRAERDGLDLGDAIPDMIAAIYNDGKVADMDGNEPVIWKHAVATHLQAALPAGK